MAFIRGGKEQQLPGSVELTEDEAKEYQYRVINGWEPKRDVWPFHYGTGILGFCGGLSGLYINSHYRYKLRLQRYGRLSTYIPTVVFPSLIASLYHQQVVSFDIMIQKTPCPVCLEVRSAAIQVVSSVVYPAILAPLASFMMASNYFTYKIPHFSQDPVGVFKLYKKFTKPITNTLFSLAIVQGLIAMFIAYMEVKSFYLVQEKLNMDQKEIMSFS